MKRFAPILLAALALCSCSTTRVLAPGEYLLARNTVKFEGKSDGLSTSDVTPYIRQKANSTIIFGWSPFLSIYNWSDPTKDDWINNALRSVGVAPVVFSGQQVISSRENIAKHLDYLGYYHSEVNSRIDTVGRKVKVTYYVTPGTRYQIDSIVYKVPEGEFGDEFSADLPKTIVHKGDYLSEKLLEAETVRGSAYFRDHGYYGFSKNNYFFEADTLGPRNILTYSIREYTRNELPQNAVPLTKYHIGQVTIEHSTEIPFREDVLKNTNVIHPGDLYRESQVNTTYNRLAALRIFNSVGVEMAPRDSSIVDCRITMSEGNMQGFKVNLEASTNSTGLLGVSPAISIFHKNIFHGGEWLTLGFSGNFQWRPRTSTRAMEFGVTTGLSFPGFLGLPNNLFKGPNIPRTDIQIGLNYQNRPEFYRWIGTFSYGYSATVGNFRYQVDPLRATVVKVGNMTQEFIMSLLRNYYLWDSFYDHIDAGLSGQLYWTDNPDIVPKGAYSYIRFGYDSSGNVISLFNKWLPEDVYGNKVIFGLGYSQYVRADLQLGHTFSLGGSTTLATHLEAGAGYAYGSSSSMPFEKGFFAGGANSMRGWQARALGPGSDELLDFFTIPSQTGDWKLEADLELRQRLFWKIEGALFAEAGNIWSYDASYVNWPETIAADWGLGLRVNLDFILIRVDWGIKLYEPCRPAGTRWRVMPNQWFASDGSSVHFGIGYPF